MTKNDIWSKIDEKKYTWLFNYVNKNVKVVDEYSYIDDNKRNLMSIIEKNKNWSNKSKEALLFMVAKYLRSTTNNKNEKYSKRYSQAGYNLLLENRKEEQENKQDEKELINYREHQYFINILNDINFNNISTLIAHYQYLLLSLLTYQPPLRTNFYLTCKFIFSKKENDNINNFIRIDKRGTLKIYYIVNNDKVTNTKTYNINKNLSKIKIEDKKLCELINYSFEKYPRKYLFELNEKPISPPTFLRYLRNITGVDEINNDIMRSSYINWFYSKERNMNEKEKLSQLMRHSIKTAQTNYLKVTTENNCDELKDKVIELQNENKRNNDNYLNVNTKIEQKLNIKRKRDVLFQLNKYNRIVRESTLKKYNITYDNNLKKYV
jgi:hypothetical protein